MRILGIDPGTAIMGYGVIEADGNRYQLLDYGCVRTKADIPMPQRLLQLHQGVTQLIQMFDPACVSVEELFFNRNVTTAVPVGQARGIVLLAAAQNELPVYEYTPLQVKQTICGYGRAEKPQVQFMVQRLLNMQSIPKPDDAADALAIAITHARYYATRRLRGEEV
ncbi:MAG: crossover junction endodeoxyribonuclease RuvC [Firmicutes bacterium]|nr:crossover junction endodeoxyribonuclease RuvC [Bacillota bacterium]MBR7114228.1 crossover junction endodeoxyribonuclease RuvC [Bacillota bacterium]